MSKMWDLMGIVLPRGGSKLALWGCILGAAVVAVALVAELILLGWTLLLMLIGLEVGLGYIVEACPVGG